MEFLEQFVPNAVIVAICVIIGMGLKWGFEEKPRLMAGIPWILTVCGAVLGVLASFIMEEFQGIDILTAIAMGAVSGLAAGGAYQLVHQQLKLKKEEEAEGQTYDNLATMLTHFANEVSQKVLADSTAMSHNKDDEEQ